MKRILILLVFIYSAKINVAQQYQPFPTDSAVWRQIGEQHFSPYVERWDYTYALSGDTTILGQTYHKIYHKGTYSNYEETWGFYFVLESGPYPDNRGYIGAMREDSLKHIYFFRGPDYFGVSDSVERLLYDFNLNVGDTLPVTVNSSYTVNVVDAVDSILLGGVYHKSFLIRDVASGPPYFALVEGMGSTIGLMEAQNVFFERYDNLECFTKSGTTVYENHQSSFSGSPNYGCALPGTVGINEHSKDGPFNVFPNPTTGILILKTPFSENTRVEIADVLGKVIYKTEFTTAENQIDLESFPKGVYFLKATSGNHPERIQKIILQ